MKSIDNKAVKNMVEKKLNVMMGAQDVESLRNSYNELQECLKQYYDVCVKVAEYNILLSEFTSAAVEYEPVNA